MKTSARLFVVLVAILVSACFSPLSYKGDDNNGNLNIVLGGGAARSVLSTPKENLRYDLTFHGPGGQTLSRTASWGETVSVQVQPGDWSVTVKAVDPASPGTIKAIGEESITVRAGAPNTSAVKMAVYTEVSNWGQLDTAITTGNNDDFIVIKSGFAGSANSNISLTANKKVTIAAESDITINRDSSFKVSFFNIASGRLALGSPAYGGTLILDGAGSSVTGPLVLVNASASFTMNGGILQNNTNGSSNGGGVSNLGTFTMNGGKIAGNQTTGSGNGGGVYNAGTFTMNGGYITGNSTANGFGGVHNAGTFIHNGGDISGNTDGAPPAPVSAFALDSHVTAPATGAAPVTTGINVAQYTGTIAWEDSGGTPVSGNFAAATVYKAVVTLTAKSGYTFTGVAANVFTYTGAATVTNAVNSGTVTITFPATALIASDPDDVADFGSGATIHNTFTVNSTTTWDAACTAISGGGINKNYIINLTGSFSIPGKTSETFGPATVNGIKVSIRGSSTISLSANGAVLYIEANQTVILRGPILQGKAGNTQPVVRTSATNAVFVMHSGTITGNTNGSSHGGGVVVNNGTFTMKGGSITSNTTNGSGGNGGAVYIGTSGTFNMEGGTIGGSAAAKNYANGNGGGVYVDGNFNLNSPASLSSINSNDTGSGIISSGPQVYKASGSFIINGSSTGTTY